MTTPLVRASDIASMADVSRAAVTQWRKRHKDFPSPKEGVESDSPLFDRAEVERWLTRTGRLRAGTIRDRDPEVIARRITDHLRGFIGMGQQEGINLAGAALVAEYLTRALAAGKTLEGPAEALAAADNRPPRRAPHTLAHLSDSELAEWLGFLGSASPEIAQALAPLTDLDRQVPEFGQKVPDFLTSLTEDIRPLDPENYLAVYDVLVRSDRHGGFGDPPALSRLLSDLAALERGTVLDPSVGPGFTLLTVGGNRDLTLVGVDFVVATHTTAVRRAMLANRVVDLRVGNSLGTDPAAGVLADAVITSPPWGIRDFGDDVDLLDPRWVFGRPSPRSEGIWIQHAIGHLSDSGRAFVVMPRTELTNSGPSEALRHELLRRGTVEAVISLPTDLWHPYARLATAIWVLTKPGQVVDRDRVLLINIPSKAVGETGGPFREAVEQYRKWRSGAEFSDTKNSMLVPVRDLLEPGVGLSPEAWLSRRDMPQPQEIVDQIRSIYLQVAQAPTPRIPDLPEFAAAPVVRREKLSALAGVDVHRGVRLTPTTKADAVSGVPALTGRTLSEYARTGILTPHLFVRPEELRGTPTPQPGDIVVTGIGRIPAHKIDFDGWAVTSPGFFIRIDPTLADPDYLVAAINAHARTQMEEGAEIPRILPSRTEIPVLSLPDQQRIGRALEDLHQASATLEQHLGHLRDLARLLEAAAGAGALTAPD
ncbi:N-6 DNA methylase [Rhodococcus sp. BH2-1]|nr:N-6 DNA methylase [Rhodococcus sp. BH2-1]